MTIIGMMWNKNEGDILEEIIHSAVHNVDTLFIADDGSDDQSWDIIQSAQRSYVNIEHIQQKPDKKDKAQRNSLLNEIRRRYKPEDSWVQVIESDIMILDTDVRQAIAKYAQQDMVVHWQTLNGVRKPGTWAMVDTYPHWQMPLHELMPYAHWMETMTYTFRPLEKLRYSGPWRPWPQNWSAYTKNLPKLGKRFGSPLLAHYGHRGPTHWCDKRKNDPVKVSTKYPSWRWSTVEEADQTVSFFNGEWNGRGFDMSRAGWEGYMRGLGHAEDS